MDLGEHAGRMSKLELEEMIRDLQEAAHLWETAGLPQTLRRSEFPKQLRQIAAVYANELSKRP